MFLFVIDFWWILVPTWPQLGPPNRPKINKQWFQNSIYFSVDLLIRFWLIFVQFWSLWNLENWALTYTRAQCSHFWCVYLGITFSSILEWFWRPSWGQVGTKIDQKSIKKSIKKWMRSWGRFFIDFGLNLAPSWGSSWGQVGTKIGGNGLPRRCQKIIKNLETQWYAMVRSGMRVNLVLAPNSTTRVQEES